MKHCSSRLIPGKQGKRDLMNQSAWVEIDLRALRHNFRAIRRLIGPDCQVMATIKANAYGHEVLPCAKTFIEEGAQRLAVSNIFEALELREEGISVPLMILSELLPSQMETAIENEIIQTVFSLETAQLISGLAQKMAKKVKIHLKVDTGMARIGFLPNQSAIEDIQAIFKLPGLEVEGLFSHFADSDNSDKSFSLKQLELFRDFKARLQKAGLEFPLLHMANSGAIIDLPESHLDMVRPGIILYGHYPSPAVDTTKLDLKPVLALKALIANLKKWPAGSSVGYSRQWVSKRDSLIATVQLGYGDGFLRALSKGVSPLVKGVRAPIVGNICMDFLMLDVTHIPGLKIGDCAVFIGEQDGQTVCLEELAETIGTIPYELACILGLRLPKVFLD